VITAMTEPLDASALLKAFSVLLHDVRTPLGVAHGYVRLLREERLTSEADRARAMQGIADALERLTRLSPDAAAFVHVDEVAVPLRRVAADEVAGRLAAALGASLAPADRELLQKSACALRSGDAVTDAIAVLAGSVATGAAVPDLHVDASAGELHILLGPGGDRSRLRDGARAPFDPWRAGHALTLARASHVIARNGGTVWANDAQRAIGVSLPLEVSA